MFFVTLSFLYATYFKHKKTLGFIPNHFQISSFWSRREYLYLLNKRKRRSLRSHRMCSVATQRESSVLQGHSSKPAMTSVVLGVVKMATNIARSPPRIIDCV